MSLIFSIWGSSVSVETSLGAGWPGFDSRRG